MADDRRGPQEKPAQHYWLTARRLRAHGTIVAICLLSVYTWTLMAPGLHDRNGNLKGTDLLHLYTLGAIANAHRGADLYDMNAQADVAWQRVPEAAGIRYLPLYPPQVSLLFAPLAQLSYGWALVVWWICSGALYAICCYSVWRACPNLRCEGTTVAALAVGFPPFFHLIAWGQTSALALAFFTLAFFFLREGRGFFAGLALGCLIFKPQLGIAAAIIFVATGAWKTVLGAAFAAAIELCAGVLYYGVAPLREWIRTLTHVRTVLPLLEPKPYQTYSLRTFWSMIVPWPEISSTLYALSAVIVLAVTIALWMRSRDVPLAIRYSVMLFASVMVAPHLTVYDLVILAPALMLLADWLVGESGNRLIWRLGTVLYFMYMLPLLGPLARYTHLQLGVIAMATAVFLIARMDFPRLRRSADSVATIA